MAEELVLYSKQGTQALRVYLADLSWGELRHLSSDVQGPPTRAFVLHFSYDYIMWYHVCVFGVGGVVAEITVCRDCAQGQRPNVGQPHLHEPGEQLVLIHLLKIL